MRRTILGVVILMAIAPTAMAQAITGFSGGGQYASYYGSTVGDVVGYRFEVTDPVEVEMVGVWNADTNGLGSVHQVGIWNASQSLIISVPVDPTTGTVMGDWTYAPIGGTVTLNPGQVYTAGAMYTTNDDDNYISGADSMTTDPSVVWLNPVFPFEIDLGFVYPTEDSPASSLGRFGPNFTFTVVPVELQSFSVE